jgi:hypothetical protein
MPDTCRLRLEKSDQEIWQAIIAAQRSSQYMVPLRSMGRSQVVRQRILIPPFPGSNPGAPANRRQRLLSLGKLVLELLKNVADLAFQPVVFGGASRGRTDVIEGGRLFP